jgi:predicted RNase H-like nuclease (RuvC/YqgF family)
MAEYFDENGQKVEAFTQEEIEERLEAERGAAIEEANASRQEEVDSLVLSLEEKEKELETYQKNLEVEKDKDKNLGGQRKVIENKEKEIKELKEKLETVEHSSLEAIEGIKKDINTAKVENIISSVSGEDSSLKEKVKFFYDSFKGEPSNEEEVKERVKNAYVLATGGKSKVDFSGDIISGAGASPSPKVDIPEGKIPSELIPLAKQLGLTDQEMKKHKLI